MRRTRTDNNFSASSVGGQGGWEAGRVHLHQQQCPQDQECISGHHSSCRKQEDEAEENQSQNDTKGKKYFFNMLSWRWWSHPLNFVRVVMASMSYFTCWSSIWCFVSTWEFVSVLKCLHLRDISLLSPGRIFHWNIFTKSDGEEILVVF